MQTPEMLEILNRINQITSELKEYVKTINRAPDRKFESDQVNEVYAAFSKAQGEFKVIRPSRDNHHFKSKYADVFDILQSVSAALAKNGLSIRFREEHAENGKVMLYTRLMHASGQWFETEYRIVPEKPTIQSFGSALTYGRRYSLLLLLGIQAPNDPDDDDGENERRAFEEKEVRGTNINYQSQHKSLTYERISDDNLQNLLYELNGWPDLLQRIYEKYDITELANLPADQYRPTFDRILEIKKTRLSIGDKPKA